MHPVNRKLSKSYFASSIFKKQKGKYQWEPWTLTSEDYTCTIDNS